MSTCGREQPPCPAAEETQSRSFRGTLPLPESARSFIALAMQIMVDPLSAPSFICYVREMATQQRTVQYLLEKTKDAGLVSAKPSSVSTAYTSTAR